MQFFDSKNKSKISIIIPACDEEKNIAKTINLIRETKINANIIVISDGSIDKTVNIAKQMGVEVIEKKQNHGKAQVIFEGITHAISKGSQIIVTIDADMLEVPKTSLQKLIRFAENAQRKKIALMVVGRTKEKTKKGYSVTEEYSGIRAFNSLAAQELIQTRTKKFVQGYALEHFLNNFFQNRLIYLNTHFVQKEAYRDGRQFKQMQQIRQSINLMPRLKKLIKKEQFFWQKQRKRK